jgi:hypothetical protein
MKVTILKNKFFRSIPVRGGTFVSVRTLDDGTIDLGPAQLLPSEAREFADALIEAASVAEGNK